MSMQPSDLPGASQDTLPPPYTEQAPHSPPQQSQTSLKKQSSTYYKSLPFVRELSNSAHPSKYTLPDSSSQDTSPEAKKSMWQKLKEENAERKAKNKHVTHEQAARMVGHNEEWQKERSMGSEGKDGWVRDPVREDKWWGTTMESEPRGDP